MTMASGVCVCARGGVCMCVCVYAIGTCINCASTEAKATITLGRQPAKYSKTTSTQAATVAMAVASCRLPRSLSLSVPSVHSAQRVWRLCMMCQLASMCVQMHSNIGFLCVFLTWSHTGCAQINYRAPGAQTIGNIYSSAMYIITSLLKSKFSQVFLNIVQYKKRHPLQQQV